MISHTGLFMLLFLSASLFAQKTVTLEEAFRIGLENNLALKQQQISTRQARIEPIINKTFSLPTVEFGAGVNYVSELAQLELPPPLSNSIGSITAGVKNQYDLNLQLTQPVFSGFRTRNLVKAGEAQAEAQFIGESAFKNDLLLQIGMMYYRIQGNLLSQEVISAAIERIDQRLEQVKNYYQAGQAAAFDTLESANRKLQQQTQLQSLRYAEAILLQQFASLLNIPEAVLVNRDEAALKQVASSEAPPLPGKSADGRAELQRLAKMVLAQQYTANIAKSAFFPQINAAASVHYARPGVNFFRDEWMHYYTVGVNLRWTLWNWQRDQQKLEQARLAIRKLELQQQQLRQTIDTQITAAYQNLQAVRGLAETQRRLVSREGERYRISEEKFRQSQISAIDLSDAESDLTTATLFLQQYVIQLREWQLQLDHATGVLLKTVLPE